MWTTLSDSILSVVYPQQCNICHNEVESSADGIACSGCWTATRIFNGTEPLCEKCGAFLFGRGVGDSALCGRCSDHHYDRARSVGIYESALSASVLRLKRVSHVSGRVKRLLISAFERMAVDGSSVVVPVPLSRRRQRERGFNQAEVLARVIERYASMSLDRSSLVRKIHTPMHRVGMDKKARALTVEHAFEVVRPRLVENRTILLVDDVFTSGETASMCAKVLKKNGASTVHILTLARAA